MVRHHIGFIRMHPDRTSCLNLSANCSNGLTYYLRLSPTIQEDKNSVLSLLKCMDGSVLAFLKSMDGSVLAFLKCTDGSVWEHLNGKYGSEMSHLRFPTQSAPTRFPQSVNSGVPWLLCKKSNKTSYLKQNELSIHFRKARTEPSMHFRRDNTEFLSCKMLCKNLH